MAFVNKVFLIGNLGRDPEIRYGSNGSAICTLSIATTKSWKDKVSGERKEETEWHRVVLYDRLAEIASEYLKKGRSVYIEGRLKTRKWQDKDNQERYTTEIIADVLQLIGGRDGAPSAVGTNKDMDFASDGLPSSSGRATAPRQERSEPDFADMDDDIPF